MSGISMHRLSEFKTVNRDCFSQVFEMNYMIGDQLIDWSIILWIIMIMIGWLSFKPTFCEVALHPTQSGTFGAEDVYCWQDCIIGMRVVDVLLKILNTITSAGIMPSHQVV